MPLMLSVTMLSVVMLSVIMPSVIMLSVIMLSVIMLSVVMLSIVAECHYAECHYTECRYAEYRYAECRYAECCYAECRYPECVMLCRGVLYLLSVAVNESQIKVTLFNKRLSKPQKWINSVRSLRLRELLSLWLWLLAFALKRDLETWGERGRKRERKITIG